MGAEVERNTRMKLLIVTQVVDSHDSDLGFFVRWIEEFAKHAERVEVICLKEGQHTLPANVHVHSLGKEKGVSRFGYVLHFYKYLWQLRHNYDAVFVHMNPEYVVLGGLWWRLTHKRVSLWYMHKSVNLKLRIAALLSNVILTGSKESFRLKSKKVQVTGHGIDTDFFSPDASVKRGDWLLSVGRLMKSKRHDLVIRVAVEKNKELRIAGEGPERANLEALARSLNAKVTFLGPLSQAQLRDEYRAAALFIHTSETGSLDKVTLEALACGLPISTNDPALKYLETASPEYVREHHSLKRLIPVIVDNLKKP
jgi:glycosyltransferase involved in cell wall biosynthesis